MNETRTAVAEHLRMRHHMIRAEKERLLTCLRTQEIEEARLEREFQEAFPDESLAGPVVRFDDLSLVERHLLHFIAGRGRVRKIPLLLAPFTAMSGIVMTEAAFRTHLTRLREKGAVMRGHLGWAVVAEHLLRARETPPPFVRGPGRTGMGEIAKRANQLPAWTRRAVGTLSAALQEVFDRIPKDRAIRFDELLEFEPAPGPQRRGTLSAKLQKLIRGGHVLRVGYGTYVRAGVTLPANPAPAPVVPAGMLGILEVLPTQQAITLAEWTRRAINSEEQEARDVMSARASVLVRLGFVQRVGRALFRRRAVQEEEVKPAARAEVARPDTGSLPPALAAVLARIPGGVEKTLDELQVECDGDPLLERGRLSGHVGRLVQRGFLERTAPRTYRRTAEVSEPDAGALRHFTEDGVLTVAQLVTRADGRISASGMKQMKAEIDMLVRAGSVERVEGGYRRRGGAGTGGAAGAVRTGAAEERPAPDVKRDPPSGGKSCPKDARDDGEGASSEAREGATRQVEASSGADLEAFLARLRAVR